VYYARAGEAVVLLLCGGDKSTQACVVNAVLQMMDAYAGRSVLIAATNHEAMLDLAIWRRFEEVLVFEPPNTEQLHRLLAMKLSGVRRDFDIEDVIGMSIFEGMSHADIERPAAGRQGDGPSRQGICYAPKPGACGAP
jgi:AAA+ superfamily predicted ATPase